MSKKVLITGASGFVGYHLIVKALAQGLTVFAAVRLSSDVSHLQNLNVTYVNLNFNSVESLRSALEAEKYDFIIHAAGSTKAKTQQDYNKVNADYSRNLAHAAATANYKVEKFVFVSSLAAIGPIANFNSKIDENTIPKPITAYGISKKVAEEYLNTIENLPLVTVRPTAVYGPREKDIFILFDTINKGFEPYIGKIDQQLSFIYVEDLAEIIVQLLSANIVNKTYNICDGNVYNRYALADNIKKSLEKKTLKIHIPLNIISAVASLLDFLYAKSKTTPTLNKEKINELTAPSWACSITNLKTDLLFEPKYNLEKGVAETVRWYKINNWL